MTDKLTKKQEKVLGEFYSDLEEMIEDLEDLGAVSREFSLVLTKLQEARMWCEQGFEVKGYEPEEADDEGDGDDGDDGDAADKEGEEGDA